MTMARMIKLFKLPAEPMTPGLRPMGRHDITGVRLMPWSRQECFAVSQQLLAQPRGFRASVTASACALPFNTLRTVPPPCLLVLQAVVSDETSPDEACQDVVAVRGQPEPRHYRA